jgi:hypothetical protein
MNPAPIHKPRSVELRAPVTYAEALAGARERQKGRGMSTAFLTVTDEELARADAQMEMLMPVSARVACVPVGPVLRVVRS